MNNQLLQTKTDEKTEIEYHLDGDYYIPNIVPPKQEKIILNKYGRMRLKYLKEYKKPEYTIMLMNVTLNTHLKGIQETAQTKLEQIIDELKTKSDLTEDMKNTDMIYWVGTMNSIKSQSEEIICKDLIYIKKIIKSKKLKLYNLHNNMLDKNSRDMLLFYHRSSKGEVIYGKCF